MNNGLSLFGLRIQPIAFLVHFMTKHNISELTILYTQLLMTQIGTQNECEQQIRIYICAHLNVWMHAKHVRHLPSHNRKQCYSPAIISVRLRPHYKQTGTVLHKYIYIYIYIVCASTKCKNHIKYIRFNVS